MAQIQIGETAPDFSLFDTDKKLVTLSEQRGSHVLLLFFPLAFTSVCTAELCFMRDNLKVYEELDAKLFGISIDHYTLSKNSKKNNILTFTC